MTGRTIRTCVAGGWYAVVFGLCLVACDFMRTGVTCEDTKTCPASSGAAGEAGADGFGGVTATGTTTQGGIGGSGGTGGPATSSGGAPTSSTATTTSNTGGTAGSSVGGTGGTIDPPCDDSCDGATPACDRATDTCVECTEDEPCTEGVCDTETHTCVECRNNDDCTKGVCDPDGHLCVECLDDDNCDEPTRRCDMEQQFCVECLESTDCTDPQASRCDAGSCSPCATNDDCTHLTGTTVCDTAVGQCVQCTIAEEAVCGGTSCNPTTRTCTNTELGTVGSCEPCVADSECIGNDATEPLRRCVPMEFNSEPREQAYCLVRRSQVSECEQPYFVVVPASSLSGAPEEPYCGVAQGSVTCEAVLDLQRGRSCPGGQDSECGCPRDEDGNCTASGKGGLCRNLPAADKRCTYRCGTVDHCPDELTCADQDPDFCQ